MIKKKKNKLIKLFNKFSFETINLCITAYYFYSITNHLNTNIIDLYMVFHHIITLSFLLKKKYPLKAVNYIHGNLIIADFPNVILDLFIHRKFVPKKIKNTCIVLADSFFIIYKLIFINSYHSKTVSYYNKNNQKNIYNYLAEIIEHNHQNWFKKNNGFDYNLLVIFNLMYTAVFFKINRIMRKLNIKNNYLYSLPLIYYSIFFKFKINLLKSRFSLSKLTKI